VLNRNAAFWRKRFALLLEIGGEQMVGKAVMMCHTWVHIVLSSGYAWV